MARISGVSVAHRAVNGSSAKTAPVNAFERHLVPEATRAELPSREHGSNNRSGLREQKTEPLIHHAFADLVDRTS